MSVGKRERSARRLTTRHTELRPGDLIRLGLGRVLHDSSTGRKVGFVPPGTTVLALTSLTKQSWAPASMRYALVVTSDGALGVTTLWASDKRPVEREEQWSTRT